MKYTKIKWIKVEHSVYCWVRVTNRLRAGATWDSTLPSVNLNHILQNLSFWALNWNKDYLNFFPTVFLFFLVLLQECRTCFTCNGPCQLSLLEKGVQDGGGGEREKCLFSRIPAIICVKPAEPLYYWGFWQVQPQCSLAQSVWISSEMITVKL